MYYMYIYRPEIMVLDASFAHFVQPILNYYFKLDRIDESLHSKTNYVPIFQRTSIFKTLIELRFPKSNLKFQFKP